MLYRMEVTYDDIVDNIFLEGIDHKPVILL